MLDSGIIFAGVLNAAGKRYPNLTGEGRLQPGECDDEPFAAPDAPRPAVSAADVAAALVMAVTLYLVGALADAVIFYVENELL